MEEKETEEETDYIQWYWADDSDEGQQVNSTISLFLVNRMTES